CVAAWDGPAVRARGGSRGPVLLVLPPGAAGCSPGTPPRSPPLFPAVPVALLLSTTSACTLPKRPRCGLDSAIGPVRRDGMGTGASPRHGTGSSPRRSPGHYFSGRAESTT